MLLPTNPTDAAKNAAVVKYFKWGLANGDAAARQLQYVVLPQTVKAQITAKLARLAK